MNLREVWRFEVGYQFRRPTTWLYAVMFVVLPILIMQGLAQPPRHVNATLTIASATAIVGLLGVLVTAGLVGDAATRDVSSGMHPLVYTAPVTKLDYLGGRFLGAVTVNAILLLGIPIGLMIALKVPYDEAVTFGPFRLGAYMQPMLLYAWPTMFYTATILFMVAALSRRTLPMYVTSIALWIAYLYAAENALTDNRILAILFDPLGLVPSMQLTENWSLVEQNTRLIGFDGTLLLNRSVWFALSAGMLLLLYRRFRFALPGKQRQKSVKLRSAELVPSREDATIAVASEQRSFGRGTAWRQAFAIAGSSLREILLSRVFLAILAGALFIVFAFGWEVGAIVFDTATWPVTHLIAGSVLSVPISFVFALLIAIYSGELIWRNRDNGVHEIIAAAPVPEWVGLLGSFLALLGMIVIVQGVLMVAGMLLQAIQGYYNFEPWLYLQILFGFTLADYVLFAVLAMTVHVLVNQKYVGHVVVMSVFAFTVFASLLGVRHHLLVYNTDPGWVYSDMNGFGPFVGPFVWFKLYWAGWALVLAVIARLFLVHGTEGGLRTRWRLARQRSTLRLARVVSVAAFMIVTLGGFIFYNTNILNDYRSAAESSTLRAEYERRFKRYEDAPQPRLVKSELRVEIYPDEPSVDLSGTYRLVNLTQSRIDSVHVLTHPEMQTRYMAFDPPARVVAGEKQLYTYRIYALEKPLLPGDSLRLVFRTAFKPRGFPNSGISTAVVRNGAYFDRRWLPVIGYQSAFETADGKVRREQGLPKRQAIPLLGDPKGLQHRFDLSDADLVNVDAVVGTDENQIAVTPGTLVREWRANGRRYFHYKTDEPISNGVPFLSAEYAVRKDKWNDVALEILHFPTHTFNLDRMMQAMKASLDYFSSQFGPYQFRQLRIVEFPRYASFARAHPHTIAFSEGGAFLSRIEESDVDRPFFVTAHETAHQWWGGQVSGAVMQGAALLSETLAQYGAMMVMEKTYGVDHVRRFVGYERHRYVETRGGDAGEPPLLRVGDESYLYYHKGAVAMYALRDHLGEERVNAALRRFLEKHRAGKPPFPTSLDLYAELRRETPDSLTYLLRDLFESITLWDMKLDSTEVEATGDGEYAVTLHVTASKARADSVGNETAVPMDDLIDIGVFAEAKNGERPPPLYLQKHRIKSGHQSIVVTVSGVPVRAAIDPYYQLIQRKIDDNFVTLDVRQR